MLWKTEEKVLPVEKRDEDSGKLMLTGRSAEGKGCLSNAGSGPSKPHGVGVNGTKMAVMLLPADAVPWLWGMGATFPGYWTVVLNPPAGLCLL